ncbi:MAG: RagB/SusD family nutrient uptake outer membrane protein [Bacteroidota bacterium]
MKNFNRKQKYLGIAVIAMVLISSNFGCKKFLDTQRQGQYYAENYPYPGGSGPYDQYIFAAYNNLRAYNVHVAPFFLATSVRSDDADKGSTASDGGADVIAMDNFPVLPSNGLVNDMWNGYFSLVSNCNITLDQIKTGIAVATDAQKTGAEAEARFLRAYAYFNMVRFWGRVPIVDKPVTVSGSNIAQSTTAQIYTFIESDLTFAAANLPLMWDKKFVGRANKGMANGLLAKVYLTQQKWAQAMSTANLVMTSGQYDLSTPYNNIFGESGENSKESIFEVQATASFAVKTTNGIQSAQYQGVRDGGIWNLGYGWNVPNDNLAAAYETGDPRYARTFLLRSTATVTNKTVYGENTATTWINPAYNHKVYTNPSYRATYGDMSGWWMNMRVLRYADVVLMYAEAANESGNTTEALDKLEQVRARARNGNSAVLPKITITDQAQLRDIIRHERRIELAMEHDRFFDIVRWGISQTALSSAGKANFVASRDNLLPIPQTQIDLSKGVLTQNSGY